MERSVILAAFPLSRLRPPHIIYQRRPRPLIASRHSWYPGQVSKHAGAGVCPEMGDTCKVACAASCRRGARSLHWGLCAGGIMEKLHSRMLRVTSLPSLGWLEWTTLITSLPGKQWKRSYIRAHTSPANHTPSQRNDKQFLGQELLSFCPICPLNTKIISPHL